MANQYAWGNKIGNANGLPAKVTRCGRRRKGCSELLGSARVCVCLIADQAEAMYQSLPPS